MNQDILAPLFGFIIIAAFLVAAFFVHGSFEPEPASASQWSCWDEMTALQEDVRFWKKAYFAK